MSPLKVDLFNSSNKFSLRESSKKLWLIKFSQQSKLSLIHFSMNNFITAAWIGCFIVAKIIIRSRIGIKDAYNQSIVIRINLIKNLLVKKSLSSYIIEMTKK